MADDVGGAGPYYQVCGKHQLCENCTCDPSSFCHGCGYRDFDKNDVYCQICGRKLKPAPQESRPERTELNYCPKCGIKVFDPNRRYCFNCDKHFKPKKKNKKK